MSADASPITVDQLEAAHWLVVGTTGSGKTYLARGLFELLRRADRRVGAIDKLGKLWGLTLAADGKAPGLNFVIFGGKRAQIPMTPSQGAAIGRLFVERNIPAIFDLSQWKASDQERWVADFANEVFATNEAALHLLIDEAQSWVPQGGGGPAYEAVRLLAEQGRGNGINLLLTAPRISGLDANVRGAIAAMVAMRQTSDVDSKRTAEIVAGHLAIDAKAFRAQLPTLMTGAGFVWSPTGAGLEQVKFPANSTFDSSRTPRHGDTPPPPIAASSTLVDELRAALAPAPDPESQKGGKPESPNSGWAAETELIRARARISELEAENTQIKTLVDVLDADCDRWAAEFAAIEEIVDRVRHQCFGEAKRHHAKGMSTVEGASREADPVKPPAPDAPEPAADRNRVETPRGGNGAPQLDAKAHEVEERSEGVREYRALGVLAAIAPAGMTEAAWAARAGYARKGGAWLRRRKRHTDAGLIEHRDGRWFATDAGIEAAGEQIPDMPAPGLGLVKWWSERTSSRAASRALQLLGAVHPRALTRDAIAAELSMAPKGGAFLRALSELKAADLVVETKKRLSAAPELMGES